MPEQDYWKERFEALNESLLKEGMDFYDEAEILFRRAQSSIDKDIAAWYQRFADNNQITLQEAQKWLRGSELEEFKWTVEDYIRRGRENGISAVIRRSNGKRIIQLRRAESDDSGGAKEIVPIDPVSVRQ